MSVREAPGELPVTTVEVSCVTHGAHATAQTSALVFDAESFPLGLRY